MIEEEVMTTLQLVPNAEIATQGPTVFKTERNQHEARCGVCRYECLASQYFS